MTSTFYSPKYDRSKFIDAHEVVAGNGSGARAITILDRLDDKYVDLINSVSPSTKYEVKVGDNLPNLSYEFYRTTTLWWVIARYNGIIDPLAIQAGDILLIPNFTDINNKVGATAQSNLGKVVVF